MNSESWLRIYSELAASCVHLFRDNGVEIRLLEEAPSEPTPGNAVVSFIGFTGDHLRGSLTLVAPVTLIKRSHPLREQRALDEDMVCDWASELANQLLGRVKNRLRPLGLVIVLSTPSAAIGEHLRAREEQGEGFRRLMFDAGADRLAVLFDAIAPDTALQLEEASPSDPQREGEVLLF
ncbi:chemotaxis protein CheX [Sorangium sp. So ce1153]|uniref:chemotaxis protein CheX n=1 Tax=Sorangium sp. So ce1153 TaxID=3133333 RepID=UPI003F63FD98